MMEALGWVDVGLLAFLAISVVFGLVRGLVFEVLSLLGWVAAFLTAEWFTPALLPYVTVGPPGSALNHGLAFAALFVAALIVWGLAARLVRVAIRATPLGPIDRLFGACFGLVRGVVVLLALATVIGLTPLRQAPAWQASEGASWLHAALQNIRPWLPPGWLQHVPSPDRHASGATSV